MDDENENIIVEEEVVKVKLTSNERVKLWRLQNAERDRIKRHERHIRDYADPEYKENKRILAKAYYRTKKLLERGIIE